MTIQKKEILELVRQLPDAVDIEESICRLQLREKLASAEADTTAGRTLSASEIRRQTAKWRKQDALAESSRRVL